MLILASGNVVHNQRRVRWDHPAAAFDWAIRFDDTVVQQLADDPSRILDVTRHPDYALAVPTPDHFIPLLYVAALAAQQPADRIEPVVRGYALGSVSMTCYAVGMDGKVYEEPSDSAGLPPNVPADQTNT